LVRADRRGYMFRHIDQIATDPKVDVTLATSQWSTAAIIPVYVSIVSNFGLPMIRKWVPKMLLRLENATNASVQISTINDNTSSEFNLKEIRYRGNYLWGDPNPVWGLDEPVWAYFNLIEETRKFPPTTLRCSYKQIKITTAFTIIYNSDTVGEAVTDIPTDTVELTSPDKWPLDVVSYFIYFEDDSYERGFEIKSRISDTKIQVLDPLSELPSGTQKWLIKGQPKSEALNIINIVVYYAPLTDQGFKTWRSEQDSTGANA